MAIPKNNSVGRPPKFKDEVQLQSLIEAYLEHCQVKDKPLTMSGLALWLGIHRSTLVNYSYNDRFFDTIKEARALVEADMEERMLGNKSNATASIFSLKNNFGWTDKQEVNSTNTNVNVNKDINLSNISTEDLRQLLKDER